MKRYNISITESFPEGKKELTITDFKHTQYVSFDPKLLSKIIKTLTKIKKKHEQH